MLWKLWVYVAHGPNKYAKEKEKEEEKKNMTILVTHHGALIATVGDSLLNNILI